MKKQLLRNSHAFHDDEVETVLLVKLGPPVSAAEVDERYRETVSCDQVLNPLQFVIHFCVRASATKFLKVKIYKIKFWYCCCCH